MSKSYEKHIRGNDVFLCSMTAEERKEYFSDLHRQKSQQRVQQKQPLSTGKVSTSEVPFRAKSHYAKCEVCGNPYLTFGRPCDHVDRRPGIRPMPDWIDNPVEWQMMCDRYVSIVGSFGRVSNGDGTYRNERLA